MEKKKSSIIKALLRASYGNGANKHIAREILVNLNNIKQFNSETIAEATYTNQSTVSKFVKTIGFSNFAEFKKELVEFKVSDSLQEEKNKDLIQSQTKIKDFLDDDSFKKQYVEIAKLIKKFKETIIIASGGASRASEEFYVTLKRLGFNVSKDVSYPTKYGSILNSCKDTLVLSISNQGKTLENQICVELAKNNKSHIVIISFNDHSDLINFADTSLILKPKDANSITKSAITTIALGLIISQI